LTVAVVAELLLAMPGDRALAEDLDDLAVGGARAAVAFNLDHAIVQEHHRRLVGIGDAVDV
jgi:hypothetical protein